MKKTDSKRPIIQIHIGKLIDKLEITIPDDLQEGERESLEKLCFDLKHSISGKILQSITNSIKSE